MIFFSYLVSKHKSQILTENTSIYFVPEIRVQYVNINGFNYYNSVLLLSHFEARIYIKDWKVIQDYQNGNKDADLTRRSKTYKQDVDNNINEQNEYSHC